MSELLPLVKGVVAVVTLAGALTLVTWRQSRTFEALAALEEARTGTSLTIAERVELERHIQWLESRGRVVPAARQALGMHTAEAGEMVFLAGEMAP